MEGRIAFRGYFSALDAAKGELEVVDAAFTWKLLAERS
jgi:hypothetical protein